MSITPPLLPTLHNQTMIPQIIAPHLHLPRPADRPHPLASHIAKQAFRTAQEIRPVARLALAERPRAMFLMRAGNEFAAQGQGALGGLTLTLTLMTVTGAGAVAVVVGGGRKLTIGFKAVIFPECDAGARRDGVFPPFEAEFVVVVADEEEGGGVAVVGGIGRMGVGEVGEVLHVDLHGGCFDVFELVSTVSGVVAVEPGAIGLILLLPNLHVAIKPPLPTPPPHIPQPPSLHPIRPRLPDVRNTDRIIMAQHLQISRLLPRPVVLLMHHHVHIAPAPDMVLGDPVRGADVPFLLVEGHEGRGPTVRLGRAVLLVVQGDGDAYSGVDAVEVEGEVRRECQGDEANGGVLEYREDVQGHFHQSDHDGYAICGL